MAPRGGRAAASSGSEDEEEEAGFSRSYFLAKEKEPSSSKKRARAAVGKLSDLNLVDEQVLRASLSEIPAKHEEEVEALTRSYKDQYRNWLFELRCGFGLLMYGFGSKKQLLEDFASTTLTDFTVIVINGYLPSINLKQVIATIAEMFWDQTKSKRKRQPGTRSQLSQTFPSQSFDDIISFLKRQTSDDVDDQVCLLIHNIDGPALRDAESQQYLAQVSCCPQVRVVASTDHVNAPLLWDKKMVHTQYKWSWYHVPTFAPYKVECVFYPLILASGGHAQTTKTALVVLQSLTPNAQSVFRVLAEYQLANEKEEGMPVSSLYTKCRERFLVSSQVTLNSHLTEFKDHDLVKIRKHSDGQDCLRIPLVFLAAFAAVAMAMAIASSSATTATAQNTPQDFVNLHNRARAADGVGPVAWDARVARYAQAYAARRAGDCRLVHSGGPYGENIFWGSAGRAWSAADAVRSWVGEKSNYHLSTNTCDPGKVCGHYTQVVWRRSTRIGCARVVCAANRGVFIVCSYDPPGNISGQRPFLTLDAAAK